MDNWDPILKKTERKLIKLLLQESKRMTVTIESTSEQNLEIIRDYLTYLSIYTLYIYLHISTYIYINIYI